MIMRLIDDYNRARDLVMEPAFLQAFRQVLQDSSLDRALAARVLTLPSEDYLAELMTVVDVDAIHRVREFCRQEIASQLHAELEQAYQHNQQASFDLSAEAMGRRSLKNLCLSYLVGLKRPEYLQLASEQFHSASNMTDQLAALRALAHTECEQRDQVLAQFYQQWQQDGLVIDKWFAVQASASLPDTLQRVNALQQHEAFDIRVPNRVRSLYGVFSQGNPVCFHDASGKGYGFLADCVKQLNSLNPQIAARLALPLIRWKRYDDNRQGLMKQQLQSIAGMPDITPDLYEIVTKGLH